MWNPVHNEIRSFNYLFFQDNTIKNYSYIFPWLKFSNILLQKSSVLLQPLQAVFFPINKDEEAQFSWHTFCFITQPWKEARVFPSFCVSCLCCTSLPRQSMWRHNRWIGKPVRNLVVLPHLLITTAITTYYTTTQRLLRGSHKGSRKGEKQRGQAYSPTFGILARLDQQNLAPEAGSFYAACYVCHNQQVPMKLTICMIQIIIYLNQYMSVRL